MEEDELPRLPPLKEVLEAVRKNRYKSRQIVMQEPNRSDNSEVICVYLCNQIGERKDKILLKEIEKINPKLKPYEFKFDVIFDDSDKGLMGRIMDTRLNAQKIENKYPNARINLFIIDGGYNNPNANDKELEDHYELFERVAYRGHGDTLGNLLNSRLILLRFAHEIKNYENIIRNGIGIGD